MFRNKALCLCLALTLIAASASARGAYIDVEEGTYVRAAQTTGSIYCPITARLSYEGPRGVFQDFTVKRGDRVEAGDVVATVLVEGSDADTQQALLSLERAREDYERGCESFDEWLAEAKESLYALPEGYERDMARLNVRLLECQYEQYRFEREYAIAQQQEACEELSSETRIVEVTAPISGVIQQTVSMRKETIVTDGFVLGTMYSDEKFFVQVANDGGGFRYGQDVQVNVGSGKNALSFSGKVVAADNMVPQAQRANVAYVEVYVDVDIGGIDVTKIKEVMVVCDNQRVEGVIVLPKNAMKLEMGKYSINLLEDGTLKKRYIVSGLEWLTQVWVMDGLKPGDVVFQD